MKKIIFSSIILLMSAVLAFSQTISSLDHIQFKGMPVDGTLAQFSSNLEKAGLPVVSLDKTSLTAIHHGSFAGYDDCTITVLSCPKDMSDYVYCISVAIPCPDDLNRIQTEYQTLKELLTLKYNEPSTETNTLHKPESHACNFQVPGGDIRLSVEESKGQPWLLLTYTDSTNELIAFGSILGDL